MGPNRGTTALAALACALALGGGAGCGVLYPRHDTLVRDPPPGLTSGGSLSPPPDEYYRISAVRAELPLHTRDARDWDSDAGPDPFVVISRNGSEIYRSATVQNSARPEWDPARDFKDVKIREADTLRIELREADGLTSELVGLQDVRGVPGTARNGGNWVIRLEGGAVVQLRTVPPLPKLGMGVTYDFHEDYLKIISVIEASPAATAGLRVGDEVVAIDGKRVGDMTDPESSMYMDRAANRDVVLTVRRNGVNGDITVHRDALYLVQ